MYEFFIEIITWGTNTPNIITADTMYQAEQGLNYLNQDDFDYLCSADSMQDAERFYEEAYSNYLFDQYAESFHF